MVTFGDRLDAVALVAEFLQFDAEIDDMGDIPFPALVDRIASSDLLVVLSFLDN